MTRKQILDRVGYDTELDLEDGGIISHLTALLDQAMADLMMVCEALETGDATT